MLIQLIEFLAEYIDLSKYDAFLFLNEYFQKYQSLPKMLLDCSQNHNYTQLINNKIVVEVFNSNQQRTIMVNKEQPSE